MIFLVLRRIDNLSGSLHKSRLPLRLSKRQSSSQYYTLPDDHTSPTCDMTPGLKPFTVFESLWTPLSSVTQILFQQTVTWSLNMSRIWVAAKGQITQTNNDGFGQSFSLTGNSRCVRILQQDHGGNGLAEHSKMASIRKLLRDMGAVKADCIPFTGGNRLIYGLRKW